MATTDTFINRCLRGAAIPAEINAYVEQWHEGKMGVGIGLHDLLGLDKVEYGRWMRDAGAIHAIVSERRAAARNPGRLPLRAFPEIEQLRHVVADVRHRAEYIGQGADDQPQYDHTRAKPSLTFRGTAKLHGTNCGVAFNIITSEVYAQSRERILSVEKDNFGFAAWAESKLAAKDLSQLREAILGAVVSTATQPIIACRAFGEWCGPVVNGKTGIGQLPVRWVVFSALVTYADGSEQWISADSVAAAWDGERRAGSLIHFISEFPQWTVTIDFNDPEAILDELERLTLEVEASCPVAKALGGDGIGEGIVWMYYDPVYGRLWFKTKGTKHKGTKNSRLIQIEPEVLASLDAFTDAVVTDSRLEQGFELIRADHGQVTEEHIGIFLKWVGQDVMKEESDTLAASGLERKQVMGRVNQRAKTWLLPRLAKV